MKGFFQKYLDIFLFTDIAFSSFRDSLTLKLKCFLVFIYNVTISHYLQYQVQGRNRSNKHKTNPITLNSYTSKTFCWSVWMVKTSIINVTPGGHFVPNLLLILEIDDSRPQEIRYVLVQCHDKEKCKVSSSSWIMPTQRIMDWNQLELDIVNWEVH